MQQNSRKKSMPKRLCVTNVTGPLLACLYIFYKRTTLKEAEVWKKIFLKQKLLSRFWNKVCRLISSAVLLRNVLVNSKLQHPPGQPPGHLTFLKIIVQIPPSLGSIRSFFMCHATYKAFFKKIPPIEITTSWQIHWHASSLTLLINIQAAGQSNWPLLSFLLLYWIAGIGIVIHYKHNLIHSYIQSLNPILKNIKI